MHNHPISNEICREFLDTISSLIAQEVPKTSTIKIYAIIMAASKEFLDKHLIYNGPRSKKDALGQGTRGCLHYQNVSPSIQLLLLTLLIYAHFSVEMDILKLVCWYNNKDYKYLLMEKYKLKP